MAQKYNPADIISRGLNAVQLLNNNVWFNGRDFLYLIRDQWPKFPACDNNFGDSQAVSALAEASTVVQLACIIPASKYSTLLRLLLVTCYVFKFINNLKSSVQAAGNNLSNFSTPAANFTVSRHNGDVCLSVADYTVSRASVLPFSTPAAEFTVSRHEGRC